MSDPSVEIARMLARPPARADAELIRGVIGTDDTGAAAVTISGTVITGPPVLTSAGTLTTGDVVAVLRQKSSILILGKITTLT